MKAIALSLIAAGALFAQSAAPAPRFGRGPGRPGGPPRDFETRLTEQLGLSAEQQNKVHTILAESRLDVQGTPEQIQELHNQLTAAIKAGDEAKIDSITKEMGAMHQQQQANHAKTIAKIYSTLTADQKTKAGENLELLQGGPMGRGPMGGRRPGPAPAAPPKPNNQ